MVLAETFWKFSCASDKEFQCLSVSKSAKIDQNDQATLKSKKL